ncbi:hypothetical protein, partial [Actinokineospora sp.]|uniref:hypothetical protein n=1 Tax=Actinokineospora sp. TaxID=1872133 RepID=UPI003D6A7D88
MKVVQEMLGHASYSFTADTYTSVLPEMAREAAEAAARLIPRSPKLSGTSRAHRTGGYRSPGVCRRVESAGVVMG